MRREQPRTFLGQGLGLLVVSMLAVAPVQADTQAVERTYVIDPEDQFAPVEVNAPSAAGKKVLLKDPNLKDIGKLAKPVAKKKPPAKTFVKKQKSHPKAIVFEALDVNGERSKPRVQFTREALPVGRSDEPVSSDFFDKVFEPLQDTSF